jgi:hypothetical protein
MQSVQSQRTAALFSAAQDLAIERLEFRRWCQVPTTAAFELCRRGALAYLLADVDSQFAAVRRSQARVHNQVLERQTPTGQVVAIAHQAAGRHTLEGPAVHRSQELAAHNPAVAVAVAAGPTAAAVGLNSRAAATAEAVRPTAAAVVTVLAAAHPTAAARGLEDRPTAVAGLAAAQRLGEELPTAALAVAVVEYLLAAVLPTAVVVAVVVAVVAVVVAPPIAAVPAAVARLAEVARLEVAAPPIAVEAAAQSRAAPTRAVPASLAVALAQPVPALAALAVE